VARKTGGTNVAKPAASVPADLDRAARRAAAVDGGRSRQPPPSPGPVRGFRPATAEANYAFAVPVLPLLQPPGGKAARSSGG
jgi:hypothetical protein